VDLGLVLTPQEQREYRALDAVGKRNYWGTYWRARDPYPRTPVNERLLEHFIRVAYARLEFGQDAWPWDARGDAYVRYGEPDYRSARGKPVAWNLVDGDPGWIRQKRKHEESMGLPSNLSSTSPFESDAWDPPPGVEKWMVVALADSIQLEMRMPPPGTSPPSLMEIWEMASTEASKRGMSSSAAATRERWVYLNRGIDLNFEDYTHNGKYTVTGDRSRAVVEEMEKKQPSLSEEEDRIDFIDPMDLVVTFKGSEGNTAMEYAFALLPDEFGSFRSVTGVYATLDVTVELFTEEWEEATRLEERSRRLQTIPQVTIRGIPLFVDASRLEAPPGSYRLNTLLMDPVSGRRATVEELLELPDFSGDELMVSDILPAALIREVEADREGRFIRNGLEVLPLPGRVIQTDQPLFIYYEIYNLAKDAIGATQYDVAYSIAEAPEDMGLTTRLFQGLRSLVGRRRQRAVLTSTVSRSGIFNDESAYLEIDLGDLPADTYWLELKVTDSNSGAEAQSILVFRTLPAPR
jgi:GWxTD domain-containing protein